MATIPQTPMMAQWQACKEAAPDTIVFFRLGDFYEAFYEDAELIARELDLTLTKRQEIPMAGVPHHMGETYLDRLVARGHRVAIAEQMEDPKTTKGIVKREVVRIVTPGTVINSTLIKDKEESLLASIFPLNQSWGLSYIDITTAHFVAAEFPSLDTLLDELGRLTPKEVLLPTREKDKPLAAEIRKAFRPTIHYLDSWHFEHKSALEHLTRHFRVESLDGFGLKGQVSGINAAGALLAYIQDDLNLPSKHIKTIRTIDQKSAMQIDKSTQRNLELTRPLHEGQKDATLLHLIDQTETPMGGRLLRKWLLHPLLSPEKISSRQDQVERFTHQFPLLLKLRSALREIRDLERLMMRIETGFASPRDLVSLRFSLEQIPHVTQTLLSIDPATRSLPDPIDVSEPIAKALVETPPMRLSDGGLFREGYNRDLDQLLTIKKGSKEWVANYQMRLREELGIKTVKVGHTRAFGYYIEVSKAYSDKVPDSFHRRQTLVNAERFVTEELKNFEYKILSCDERLSALEAQLFGQLREDIARSAPLVRSIATKVAQIDVYSSLAKLALEREYIRPTVDSSNQFVIQGGRHPVIEANEEVDFIPNDSELGERDKQLALITGPNMAGKSTYLRQAALLAILAQIGSFIPAKQARIGVIDKVFSRIGASDDLTRGQSTFMVEMTETANILNNATDRSLVILDEIGRGTSTYDGISIAWAVAEYLLTTTGRQAKTLFATHYFEMTQLAELYEGAFNLNVAVEEGAGKITFLRKIIEGAADKSYGIHVARLAGLPSVALKAAEKKLHDLEEKKPEPKAKETAPQLDLFAAPPPPHESPILKELCDLDPNAMTPLEALEKIAAWKDTSNAL